MKGKGKTKPASCEERVFLAIVRAADRLAQECESPIRAQELTGTQYNVLRILRGVGPAGLACREVADRMISHDPDMTRLLDRLEKRGLIARERQTDDRRVIKAFITTAGLEALKTLDAPIRELHQRQFEHMAATKLKALESLMNEVLSREPKKNHSGPKE